MTNIKEYSGSSAAAETLRVFGIMALATAAGAAVGMLSESALGVASMSSGPPLHRGMLFGALSLIASPLVVGALLDRSIGRGFAIIFGPMLLAAGFFGAMSRSAQIPAVFATQAIMCLVAARVLPRTWRMVHPGACPTCLYDLHGLNSSSCPECGSVLSEWSLQRSRRASQP
jgi:hypothetical protein